RAAGRVWAQSQGDLVGNTGLLVGGLQNQTSSIILSQDNVINWRLVNRERTGTFSVATGGAGTERLSVTTQGNVGIGTITPTERLDVAGNIRAAGNIRLSPATGDANLFFNVNNQNPWIIRVFGEGSNFHLTRRVGGTSLTALSVNYTTGATSIGGVLDVLGNLQTRGNLLLPTAGATVDGVDLDTVLTGITAGGGITITGEGHARTIAVGDTVLTNASTVNWSQLGAFPAACPAGQFVSAVGGTLTCAAPPESGIAEESDPNFGTWRGDDRGARALTSLTLSPTTGNANFSFSINNQTPWFFRVFGGGPNVNNFELARFRDGVVTSPLSVNYTTGETTIGGGLNVRGSIRLLTDNATVDGVDLDTVLTELTAGGGITITGEGHARTIAVGDTVLTEPSAACADGEALSWDGTALACVAAGATYTAGRNIEISAENLVSVAGSPTFDRLTVGTTEGEAHVRVRSGTASGLADLILAQAGTDRWAAALRPESEGRHFQILRTLSTGNWIPALTIDYGTGELRTAGGARVTGALSAGATTVSGALTINGGSLNVPSLALAPANPRAGSVYWSTASGDTGLRVFDEAGRWRAVEGIVEERDPAFAGWRGPDVGARALSELSIVPSVGQSAAAINLGETSGGRWRLNVPISGEALNDFRLLRVRPGGITTALGFEYDTGAAIFENGATIPGDVSVGGALTTSGALTAASATVNGVFSVNSGPFNIPQRPNAPSNPRDGSIYWSAAAGDTGLRVRRGTDWQMIPAVSTCPVDTYLRRTADGWTCAGVAENDRTFTDWRGGDIGAQALTTLTVGAEDAAGSHLTVRANDSGVADVLLRQGDADRWAVSVRPTTEGVRSRDFEILRRQEDGTWDTVIGADYETGAVTLDGATTVRGNLTATGNLTVNGTARLGAAPTQIITVAGRLNVDGDALALPIRGADPVTAARAGMMYWDNRGGVNGGRIYNGLAWQEIRTGPEVDPRFALWRGDNVGAQTLSNLTVQRNLNTQNLAVTGEFNAETLDLAADAAIGGDLTVDGALTVGGRAVLTDVSALAWGQISGFPGGTCGVGEFVNVVGADGVAACAAPPVASPTVFSVAPTTNGTLARFNADGLLTDSTLNQAADGTLTAAGDVAVTGTISEGGRILRDRYPLLRAEDVDDFLRPGQGGEIIYHSGSGIWNVLRPGEAGMYLRTEGSGDAPQWANIPVGLQTGFSFEQGAIPQFVSVAGVSGTNLGNSPMRVDGDTIRIGTAAAPVDLDVTGDVTATGDIYLTTGRALRVDASGATALNFGNYDAGAGDFHLTLRAGASGLADLLLRKGDSDRWAVAVESGATAHNFEIRRSRNNIWNTLFSLDYDTGNIALLDGATIDGINLDNAIIQPATCNEDQVLQWSGTAWECADQSAGGVTYTAGSNIRIDATNAIGVVSNPRFDTASFGTGAAPIVLSAGQSLLHGFISQSTGLNSNAILFERVNEEGPTTEIFRVDGGDGALTVAGAIRGNFVASNGASCIGSQILQRSADDATWTCAALPEAGITAEADPEFAAWRGNDVGPATLTTLTVQGNLDGSSANFTGEVRAARDVRVSGDIYADNVTATGDVTARDLGANRDVRAARDVRVAGDIYANSGESIIVQNPADGLERYFTVESTNEGSGYMHFRIAAPTDIHLAELLLRQGDTDRWALSTRAGSSNFEIWRNNDRWRQALAIDYDTGQVTIPPTIGTALTVDSIRGSQNTLNIASGLDVTGTVVSTFSNPVRIGRAGLNLGADNTNDVLIEGRALHSGMHPTGDYLLHLSTYADNESSRTNRFTVDRDGDVVASGSITADATTLSSLTVTGSATVDGVLNANSTLNVNGMATIDGAFNANSTLDVGGIIRAGTSNAQITSAAGGLKMAELANEDWNEADEGWLSVYRRSGQTCATVCDNHGLVCRLAFTFNETSSGSNAYTLNTARCDSTSSGAFCMCGG
ncbi:hypothetical protein HYW17_06070, partial [Candidatus Uhrbacteria bacterium]|nr:hypothetical protein [Candidatus Uhrbacteria bacterium]